MSFFILFYVESRVSLLIMPAIVVVVVLLSKAKELSLV